MSTSDNDAPTVTYSANCHCGLAKFTVTLPDIRRGKVVRCNCSICTKNGYLLVYPKIEDVRFISGRESLTSYRFGNAKKPHLFCPRCGTSILIDFSEAEREAQRTLTAVNLRTFVDIEEMMGELDIVDGDGKHRLNPPYQVPT